MAREHAPSSWTVNPIEVRICEAAWVAWIDTIADGYFGSDARLVRSRSILIEGLAMGVARLLLEVERGTSARRPMAVRRAQRRGDFGVGCGVHEGLREGLASAALVFARGLVANEFGRRPPTLAALTLAVSATRAVGRSPGEASPAAARALFRMELAECSGAEFSSTLVGRAMASG